MNTTTPLSLTVVLRITIPFALGYFLSYLFRAVNAVIAPDLTLDLGLTAADLGLLTSTYFLTFAAFQLPLGLLLDRIGPRRTESVLLLFAAAGAFGFAMAHSLPGLIVARGLIGFGVSACLMAAFKAFVDWFPKERLPLVNGTQMAAGGLGALTATAPVEAALQVTDWRGVFFALGAVTLLVAAVVYLAVPRHGEAKADRPATTFGEQMAGVGAIFSSRLFWRVAPLTVMSQATFLSIQSLWSGPWIRDVGGLDRTVAAGYLFWMAGAMVAGFLSWGTIAERLGRREIPTMVVAITGMCLFMIVQGAIILGWTGAVLPMWMLFAFAGTTGILPYAALSQSFPSHLAGRVNTSVNLLVFVSAFGVQWGTGAIIDLWPKTADGGYALEGYQAAFGCLLAGQVLGLLWYLLGPRLNASKT